MNRKVKLSLVLALFCITFIGCASLMKAFKETTFEIFHGNLCFQGE